MRAPPPMPPNGPRPKRVKPDPIQRLYDAIDKAKYDGASGTLVYGKVRIEWWAPSRVLVHHENGQQAELSDQSLVSRCQSRVREIRLNEAAELKAKNIAKLDAILPSF